MELYKKDTITRVLPKINFQEKSGKMHPESELCDRIVITLATA